MFQPAYELILSLVAIAAITVGYVIYAQDGMPEPGGLVGHSLGVVGFVLMLSTEVLYSVRKRYPNFHLGTMNTWLQAHIFTGLVGPYLVLLHTSWRFSGLAGVLTLATAVVVVSGIIGRYIYTAVPRDLDGAEIAASQLQKQIAANDQELRDLGAERLGVVPVEGGLPTSGLLLVLGRPFYRLRRRWRMGRAMSALGPKSHPAADKLLHALDERQRLQLQMALLDATRRVLALWHAFHVPLSAGLFTLAFIHVGAALYYATFLK
jgi:hypothetical protein